MDGQSKRICYYALHLLDKGHSRFLYSKTCLKRPLSKRPKNGFQDQLSLNAGQKYCRMQGEHSAILSTFIKLPFVIKTFVLSIFEWPLKTGFTVHSAKSSLSRIVTIKINIFKFCPSFKTSGRQLKQSNQLSLPHQDDCKLRRTQSTKVAADNIFKFCPSFKKLNKNFHIM